jgi:3-phenylpropionate/trans-cinnamate dioxygenase ferredoxin subunit
MSEVFVKICKLSELQNKRGISFSIDGEIDIAVFRVNDKIYAVENTCPHNHSHVMHEGLIDKDLYLSCPIHGYQFHLKTGAVPVMYMLIKEKRNSNCSIGNGKFFKFLKYVKFCFFTCPFPFT